MFLPCHIRVSEWIHNFLNVKELLARSKCEIWRLSDCNWTRTYNDWAVLRVRISMVHLIVCSCRVMYAFQSESTLCSWYDKIMQSNSPYRQVLSIIWPVWLNGWVFVYELSGCGFESSCIHIKNFSYMSEKLPILDVLFAVHNANYSETFFYHFAIFFSYTQLAFAIYFLGDFYIIHTHIVAFFLFLL